MKDMTDVRETHDNLCGCNIHGCEIWLSLECLLPEEEIRRLIGLRLGTKFRNQGMGGKVHVEHFGHILEQMIWEFAGA